MNDRKYPWAKEENAPPKNDARPETILRLRKANDVNKTVIVHLIYYRWDGRYCGEMIEVIRSWRRHSHRTGSFSRLAATPRAAHKAAEPERI